nr:MAG TPA: hypothetical protein [Herelleviridae sp.]
MRLMGNDFRVFPKIKEVLDRMSLMTNEPSQEMPAPL